MAVLFLCSYTSDTGKFLAQKRGCTKIRVDAGWPLLMFISCTPEGRNHCCMTSLYSTIQTSLTPSFQQKVSNHKPQTRGLLDCMWEQCEYQSRDTACDNGSAKVDLISSTDSTNIMLDLNWKTWIIRLVLPSPHEDLPPSSALGTVWKCRYYCRIPIQVSWRWQVIFCHKQYNTLVQTNVSCDGPTPTAEKLDSANVLSIWNLNLNSVPPGCIWLQDKQLPRQQKSKQTEHHTQRSPLNVFTNSEGSYSLPCQWINKRVQLLINGTRLALSYTTIIISCRKGSQSQSARVMSATKVTQQIIYCFPRAGKALEAKGVSKLSFERQWKKNLRWRFSELTKAVSYTILIHLNILSASKTCHLKYLLQGLFVN